MKVEAVPLLQAFIYTFGRFSGEVGGEKVRRDIRYKLCRVCFKDVWFQIGMDSILFVQLFINEGVPIGCWSEWINEIYVAFDLKLEEHFRDYLFCYFGDDFA